MDSFLFERFKNMPFTKNQRRIAQFMMDNEYELCQMSLMDVSKAVGVSDASVLRLVRQAGFVGYNDFKKELYEKLIAQAGAPSNSGSKLADRMRGSGEEGFPALPIAIENATQNITGSLQQNAPAAYDQVIDAIHRSRRVFIFGRRGTRDEARHFARCLRYISDKICYVDHYEDLHPALAGAGKDDLLIFFCVARFYETDLHICQAAEEKGIPICLITDQVPSVLSSYADMILRVRTAGFSYFNSMLGTLAICEYMLARISNSETKSSVQARLDFIDQFTEDERCH